MKKLLVLCFTLVIVASAFALAQSEELILSASGEALTGSQAESHPKVLPDEDGNATETRGRPVPSITPSLGWTALGGPRRPDVTLADQLCIDDGVMVNAHAHWNGGDAWAVSYTPAIYPVLVESVQVYILSEGDPYWPWPDAVHQPFAICVWDENTGQPGTEVFRDTVQADGTPPSWVITYPNVIINSGDFWVGTEQFDNNPNCEGMGVDASYDNGPQNWFRIAGVWTQDPGLTGDLMICAFVSLLLDTSRVILSGNATVVPTIDGIIDSVEWADATVKDVSDVYGMMDNPDPLGSAFLYVKNDEQNLYLALDGVWDDTENDYDDFSPYLDDNNDGLWPAAPDTSEGNLWFSSQTAGDYTVWRYFQAGPVSGPLRTVGFPVGVDFSTGHQQYEGVIPFGPLPEELQAQPGDTVGFFMLAYHDNALETYAWWPYDNAIFYDPTGYGDLVLAPGFGPVITEALASDNIDSVPGIDPDDNVLLTFDEPTNKPAITWSNIDNVFQLSGGHTWLDGFSNIGSAVWNGPGDRLIITLSTTSGLPTVAVGDTITPDGATVTDALGNPCSMPVLITGSFGEPTGVEELKVRAGDPKVAALGQSSPNPFKQETEIRYSVPVKSDVTLKVYDLSGRPVRTLVASETEPGIHSAIWDGRDEAGSLAPAGVYLYRLTAAGSATTRKLILVR